MKSASLHFTILIFGLGMTMSATLSAQPCWQDQLDFDFTLGTFDLILGQTLVHPDTGENLWTGDMGSPPIWMTIPGQLGPGFTDADNSGNGIDDDDNLDLLAAVIDGDPTVVGALNPADVTAIRNAFAANVAHLQTLEITLNNIHITGGGFLVPNQWVSITTGSEACIDTLIGDQCFDVPSLWGSGGVLELSHPLLEGVFLDLISGYMTIGDASDVDYLQAFIAQVTVAVVQNLVPALLENLKKKSLGEDLGLEFDWNEGGPKAYTVPCGAIDDISEHICITDPISICVDLFIDGNDICASIQNFINNLNCGAFNCQLSLLGASGDLNNDATTNGQSYAVATDRQDWMNLESLANPPLEITTQPLSQDVEVGEIVSFWITYAEGLPGGPVSYNWESTDPDDFGPIATVSTAATHDLDPTLVTHAGTYTVTICDLLWTRRSRPAVLTVQATAFHIETQPVGPVTKFMGEDHTFSVKVLGGTPAYGYQWEDGPAETGPFGAIGGANGRNLALTNLQVADAGWYRVQVNDSAKAALTSTVVELIVLEPIVVDDSLLFGANLVAGETHTLQVSASGGGGTRHYEWQFDNGGGFVAVGSDSPTFARSPSWQTPHQGSYQCRVYDDFLQEEYSKEVEVTILDIAGYGPTDQTVSVGDTISANVVPEGGNVAIPGVVGSYGYQWHLDDLPLGDGFVSLGPSQTDDTLEILNAQTSNNGQYKCVVTDDTPREVEVVVNAKVLDPIVITAQPVDAPLVEDETHVLSVTVVGGGIGGDPPLHYQWQFDDRQGGGFVDIPGADSTTFERTPSWQIPDQGDYRCRVRDDEGQEEFSDEAFVTVLGIASAPPAADSFGVGATIIETVLPDGGLVDVPGVPAEYTYEWSFDDGLGGGFVLLPGQTADQLNIPNAQVGDSGLYKCVVTDDAPRAVECETDITVTDSPIVILTQPVSAGRVTGGTVTFSVEATGGNPTPDLLTFQWYFGLVAVFSGGDYTVISTTTHSDLTITNLTQVSHEGTYSCVAQDAAAGSKYSDNADLLVGDPLSLDVEPVGGDFHTGDSHDPVLSVTTSGGVGEVTYAWYRDSEPLPIQEGGSNELDLSPMALSDADTYHCEVQDVGTGDGDPATYTPTGDLRSADAVIRVGVPLVPNPDVQPSSSSVAYGSDVTFTVFPVGGLGELHYWWFKNVGGMPVWQVGYTTENLELTSVTTDHSGRYYCVIKDEIGFPGKGVPEGTVTSITVDLEVSPQLVVSEPTSVTVTQGEDAFFEIAASGGHTHSYEYQWTRAGGALGANVTGEDSNRLEFTYCLPGNADDYKCTVTDASEVAESDTATLSVNAIPLTANASPESVMTTEGEDTSFTVVVSGGPTETYSYQWKKVGGELGGGNVTGATTDELVFTGLVPENAGTYYCTITDSTEIVNSNEVTIYIEGVNTIPAAGALALGLLAAAYAVGGAALLRRRR